jgi:antitoxin CptB
MDTSLEYNKSKLLWRCHRGMLELDIILQSFLNHHFDALSEEDKRDFIELIEIEDVTLYAWLLGQERPDESRYQAMIDCINSKSLGVDVR